MFFQWSKIERAQRCGVDWSGLDRTGEEWNGAESKGKERKGVV